MNKAPSTESAQKYIVAQIINLGVEEETIDINLRLDEIDIDSLDIADLITSIKQDYGVEIPRRDLIGITLMGLIERLTAECASVAILSVVPD
jgi:acyl carrier protein